MPPTFQLKGSGLRWIPAVVVASAGLWEWLQPHLAAGSWTGVAVAASTVKV